MAESLHGKPAILMIAYTNYRTDPRVIRAAEAAVDSGFDVDFIALRREGEPDTEFVRGVRLIHLRQERYRGGGVLWYLVAYFEFFMRCLFKTGTLHMQRRYRVVHVNNMPDFLVFSAIVPKLLGAKVILDIHDPMANTFVSKFKSGERGLVFRLLLLQERLAAWFSDCVLTVHEPVRRHILIEQHGMAPEAVQVVANFADDDLFRLRTPAESLGPLRLVFHGTILERYGLGDVLGALVKMKYRDRIRVRIIGEGDYSEQLRQGIDTLGLADIVEFDNRMYPLEQIPQRLADCHLGLVPLRISSITNFALPLKLIEYLALGMPSITVRSVAIGFYFADEDCFFYEPGNVDSLAQVLDRIAADPALLEQARQRAVVNRDKFLWSREKKKYTDLLTGLAG